MRRLFLKIFKWIGIGIGAFLFCLLLLNFFVIGTTYKKIYDASEISFENVDAILVFGAGIRGKKPSPMLQDRLDTAFSLYNQNKEIKIIVSGDHGTKDYDEVNVMKNYLMEKGIPSTQIFMDHAGFSSYDSLFRAREIFQVENIILVTQKYHLYRALYIANHLGLSASGVSSTLRSYAGQEKREVREFLARIKDVFKCIIKPTPTYLGESIPISSNGDLTNDY